MRGWLTATLFAATMACAGVAHAEEAKVKAECVSGTGTEFTDGECIGADDLLGRLDLTVPENALFSLMNASPDTIVRPKVGDSFAFSILPQFADALGNDQYAVGFEVNPGLLLMPARFTIAELYGEAGPLPGGAERRDAFARAKFWSQFSLSGAATKTSGNSNLTQYGFGVNFNRDTGSPLYAQGAFGNCIRRSYNGINLATVQQDRELELEAQHPDWDQKKITEEARKSLIADPRYGAFFNAEEMKKTVDACVRTAAPWNRIVYGAGAAIYRSESETPSTIAGAQPLEEEETGYGLWVAYSGPMSGRNDKSGNGQITVSARYTENGLRERKTGATSVNEAVDGWSVGARYTHSFMGDDGQRSSRAVRGFVEVAYAQEKFGVIDDEFTQAGIGFEVQLQKNLFFQATIGDTFSSAIDRDTYLSGQLKWSFSRAVAD